MKCAMRTGAMIGLVFLLTGTAWAQDEQVQGKACLAQTNFFWEHKALNTGSATESGTFLLVQEENGTRSVQQGSDVAPGATEVLVGTTPVPQAILFTYLAPQNDGNFVHMRTDLATPPPGASLPSDACPSDAWVSVKGTWNPTTQTLSTVTLDLPSGQLNKLNQIRTITLGPFAGQAPTAIVSAASLTGAPIDITIAVNNDAGLTTSTGALSSPTGGIVSTSMPLNSDFNVTLTSPTGFGNTLVLLQDGREQITSCKTNQAMVQEANDVLNGNLMDLVAWAFGCTVVHSK